MSFVYLLLATLFNWLMTLLGSLLVYFTNKKNDSLICIALGSSAGIMIAASFYSLLLPAMNLLESYSRFHLLIIPFGFLCGVCFLFLSDIFFPYHFFISTHSSLPIKHHMLILAMTFHNIPEGFVVGVAFASKGNLLPALLLSIGIGIQNFPEGTAISLPMHQIGINKFKSFMYGQLSGLIEIPSAIIGYLFASFISSLLPFCLSFAAGAMLYVCIEELIPKAKTNGKYDIGSLSCMIGFLIMMFLDIMLS